MIFSPAQKTAIEHDGEALLIIAGAGTGKTRVITHRMAYLIATKQARPHEILALTFTEKAASEMEERVDGLTPYGYTDVSILTFHAFGDRILREFGLRMGLPPDFQVLSQSEQVIFFKKHLFDFPLVSYRPLGNPTRYIESLLAHISRLKDEAIAPLDYQVAAERLFAHAASHPENPAFLQEATLQKELAATYALYCRLTLENHRIDYGDQVYLALDLLRLYPAVLQKLPYRYILVDEFQDTNRAQFLLLQALTQQGAAITVVGDDDQSIYRFRGASISNIQQFTTVYPNATKVVLTQNFRSRQEILDAAYRLIQYNNPNRLEVIEKVNKRLYAACDAADDNRDTALNVEHDELVQHRHFNTLAAEADWVARTILDRVAQKRHYREFAILVRRNADADPYLRALNLLNIPNRFTGNQGLFNRPEVRLMIAFMRAVCDRDDSASLYVLLSSDLYRFPIALLAQQMVLAKRSHRSLYAVMDEAPTGSENEDWAPFYKWKEDLDTAQKRSLEVEAGVVLYEFIKKSGFLSLFSKREDDLAIQNIARFFGEIKRMGQQTLGFNGIVDVLDLLREAGDDPAMAETDFEEDAVSVLTVHRAKGLEFDTVFMVGLCDGVFPSRARESALSIPSDLLPHETDNLHIEEERRLFYVGMTRAKARLILSHAQYKHGAGGETHGAGRPRKVSPFVMEALNLPRAAIRAVKSSPLAEVERAAGVVTPTKSKNTHLHLTQEKLPSERPKTSLSLTYYQMDDYLTCPLKYKYIHILGVPIYPHHTTVYGHIMHQAIATYLMAKREGVPFTADAILHRFEDGWKSEGYLSRAHEDQRMATGRQALLRFYEEEEKRGVRPTDIEKEFSFLFEGIKIKGRWDRIDEMSPSARGLEPTQDKEAVIIDYKTSDVGDQKTADKKARESMQLTLYAWAYRERTSVLPKAVWLHFVESGRVGRSVRDETDIEKIKDKVRSVAAGIRAGNYDARPTYMACGYCAYQDICPATASQ